MSLVAYWLRLCTPSAGAWVWSLVRELDPTCHQEECMLQLKISQAATKKKKKILDATVKILYATIKTWHSQINK